MFLRIAVIALIATIVPHVAKAAYTYQPLEPFPEVYSDLPSLLVALYNFAIGIVGIAALFMLGIGGFMYMTSAGNNASAETAKRIIRDALAGLVMALFAWLLLFVINPDLVRVNFNFNSLYVPTGTEQGTQTQNSNGGGAQTNTNTNSGGSTNNTPSPSAPPPFSN